MARKLHVVVSQGQSAHPAKRKLEEDLVAALLGEPGIEVTVVPHLYDLTADGTGMLCLQSISGDMVVLSWLYPRAAHWILDRNQVRGKVGRSLLEPGEEEDEQQDGEQDPAQDDHAAPPPRRVADDRPLPPRTIWCLDLRARETAADFLAEIRRIQRECSVATVELTLAPPPQAASASNGRLPAGTGNGTIALPVIFGTPTGNGERAAPFQPPAVEPTNASKDRIEPPPGPPSAEAAPLRRVEETPARRWYPVIDYSRCTNCMQCIDFCLFGVYGVDAAQTILVEQPDNCRKGCPACSRVCPENAIIFPQHKTPAIAGSPTGAAGSLKIDLSKLFGAPDALEVAVLERDVELVAAGRQAVGMTVGIPKRQQHKQGPKDDLDRLIDQLDELNL
ncbi:MAG: ferredoxin family protein [Pirellulales bacterium]|nr:ferredoxin family protein [Pirellulales bacterium]